MKKLIISAAIVGLLGSVGYANEYPTGGMPAMPPGVSIPSMGSNQAAQQQFSEKWKVPSYKKVCKYIVDVEGWQAEKCSGSNMKAPSGELVAVERDYTNGNKKVGITVLNGSMVLMSWAPFAQGVTIDSDKEFLKVFEMKGYKVGVGYDKIEHSGTIAVPLIKADELKNEPAFAVFGVNFENMDYKEALDFIENFDFEALESLFRK